MPPRKPRSEVTRLPVKDELRFQAWAHRNGITDVDHPDSHYDYRGYWRSVKGADHQQGAHFPDTFKQHGHPTFSVESQYSRGPNDGGHWQGENFVPPVGPPADQRIPNDILPTMRPRNRAGEVARSLAFNYPRLAGALSGAGNVAKGVVNFVPETLRSLSSFTPEELRDPAVHQQIKDNGWGDPDQMLHEALRARGRGEPVGAGEGAAALLKGTATMGYNLQRAVQGGALYERDENGKLKLSNNDVSPRERAQAVTEMLGNTALLASGTKQGLGGAAKSLGRWAEWSTRPTMEQLLGAVNDQRGSVPASNAILPQDWTALSRNVRGGRATPVGNLNLEAPTYTRARYTAPVSAPNTSLDVPAFRRRGLETPHTLGNIRSRFRTLIGGGEALPRVDAVNESAASQMAHTYENLKSDPTNPEVRSAYEAFNRETQAQADALKSAGYTWDFVDHDPYPPTKGGSRAMLRDLRDRHIEVYKTTGEQSHPLMTNEQNNLFRAVHEILGHGVDEVPFSAKGEENAFRSHAQMYSPEARRVMATETRGQNSWFNYGPHKGVPAPSRPFAAQKAALWPTEQLGDYSSFPAERIAAPSVKGADGQYYTGLNHDFASEAAADAMRATPEGRAAMEANRGSATVRGSQGFKTSTGRYISREEARNIAGFNGQAPKLASQYSQLHSSDISNPNNFAGEYAVPKDLIAAAAPNIGRGPAPLFNPEVGAPGIAQMIRAHGRPESGSILKYVDPGTYLHDVPQTVFDLPAPKKGISWGQHFSNAREVLNLDNRHLMDAIYRGLELNRNGPGQSYPWWYNAEPILGSAMEHLGPELGLERFNMLADRMKPTSINTEPVRNLRNASYQYYRTGNPSAPLFTEGYRPLYPTDMEMFLQQLERQGGHMTQPKIEPYGEAFKGNWGTSVGDMHYHRSLEALGVPYGADADPGVRWGPYNAAFTDFAHDLQGEGLIPDVPGRSPAAPAQAAMWGGMGELTGVNDIKNARPTIWQMFEDATHRSARHLGMKPEDFLHHFWNREVPLF